MDNQKIIEFPKSKVVRELPEEVHKERQAKADQKMADSIVDEITGMVLTELDNYYIDIESKQFGKDFVLVADAIQAAVYRHFAIEHHLHTFIDNNIKVIEGDLNTLSKEEIKEKIENIMAELTKAKDDIDKEP